MSPGENDTRHDDSGSEAVFASSSAQAPEQVGPYYLLERLGSGGMGVVYLAQRVRPIRKQVALKLTQANRDSWELLRRFEDERQLHASLSHPNIAQVFDAGTSRDGRPYFVMEYVPGVPITEYADRHRLKLEHRLDLFLQACRGVQHAHSRGVLHRDLKPANILVAAGDGQPIVKVIDFGIAKPAARRLKGLHTSCELGSVIGTPEFMSPEQAEMTPEDVDHRADIYSLGVLLQELVAGTRPISLSPEDKSSPEQLRRRLRETEPLPASSSFTHLDAAEQQRLAAARRVRARSLGRRLRGDLDAICRKALAKERNERYTTAAELAADIERYLRGETVLARPATTLYLTRKILRRHRVGLAVLAGALLSAAAAWQATRPRHASLLVHTGIVGASVSVDGELAGPSNQVLAGIAPGRRIVAVANPYFETQLYERELAAGEVVEVHVRLRLLPDAPTDVAAAFQAIERAASVLDHEPTPSRSWRGPVLLHPRGLVRPCDLDRFAIDLAPGVVARGRVRVTDMDNAEIGAFDLDGMAAGELPRTIVAALRTGESYAWTYVPPAGDPVRAQFRVVEREIDEAGLRAAFPGEAERRLATAALWQSHGFHVAALRLLRNGDFGSRTRTRRTLCLQSIAALGIEDSSWARELEAKPIPPPRQSTQDSPAQDLKARTAALYREALALLAQRKAKDALALVQRAAREAEAGGLKAFAATILHNAGIQLVERAWHAEAEACYRESLRLKRELGDVAGAVQTRVCLANSVSARGDLDAAIAEYDRAVALARPDGDPGTLAHVLVNRGNCRRKIGQLTLACEDLEDGLRLIERSTLPARQKVVGQAIALQTLGQILRLQGETERAIAHFERALELKRTLGDERSIGIALQQLAVAHMSKGELALAYARFEQALALAEKCGDREGVASLHNDLGVLLERIGDSERALARFLAAQKLYSEIGYRAQAARASLSALSHRLRRTASDAPDAPDVSEALVAALETATEQAQAIGDSRVLLEHWNALGVAHKRAGNLERARAAFRAALKIARATKDRENEALVLVYVGSLQLASGDPGNARTTFARAHRLATSVAAEDLVLRALEGASRALWRLGATEDALAHARTALEGYVRLGHGLSEPHSARLLDKGFDVVAHGTLMAVALDAPAEMWWFLERGRAQHLLEALGGGGNVRQAVLPATSRVALNRAHDAVRVARERALRSADAAADTEYRAAEAELRSVIDRLRREHKAAADVAYPEVAKLTAVQAVLDRSDALVLYALLERQAFALVVTRSTARIVRLGAVAEIRRAQRAFEPQAGMPAEGAKTLYALAIEPLALDKAITRVLVSPHDALSFVPFTLLLPGCDIAYVPSGTTYLALRARYRAPATRVLALGDPAYRDPALRLEASRAEVRRVANGPDDRVLLDQDANELALRSALREAPHWRAVHLACHGDVHAARPLESGLRLAPSRDGDDLWMVVDVLGTPISADLAVLSACDTGVATAYRSEGLVGLTSAFLFAGSSRVIASLWRAEDAATAALMTRFYELWRGGDVGVAAALRRAQEHVRSQPRWKHPRYWAGWVVWGGVE